ncbi:phage virion morphogenesis protein [Salmonella enterica]
MIDVKLDDKALQHALKSLEIGCKNLTPAMRKIAGSLQAETAGTFEDEGRPAWVPSLAAKKRGGPTLRDTGALARSITTQYDADHAMVGSNLAYAAIHQLGGEVKRKGRKVYFRKDKNGDTGRRFVKKKDSNVEKAAADHTATYPARPFLPVDSDGNLTTRAKRVVIATILRHLESAARG